MENTYRFWQIKAMNKPSVCIIIPAYNEAPVLEGVIKDLQKILQKERLAYQIVVINDASSDNTSAVAKRTGVTVIDHILNSGAGGATATGLQFARKYNFDIAVTVDADGQHLAKDVAKGIKEIHHKDVDLLIGSRLIDTTGMSRMKVLGNRGLSIVTHLFFGVNVTDSQSGLRVFSKGALDKIYWKSNGYEFCSEMLWRAKQQHLKIAEYPIQAVYTDYSKSKGQSNWNAINIVKSLLRSRLIEVFE